MGCALSAADDTGKKHSDEIDKKLVAERMNRNNEIKLLLLGESNLHCVNNNMVATSNCLSNF